MFFKIFIILPLLAFVAAPCFAQDSATNATPVRTLKEAVLRLWDYEYRSTNEWFQPHAIRVDSGANGEKTWTFSCESIRYVETQEMKSGSDEDGNPSKLATAVVLRLDSTGKISELSRKPAKKDLVLVLPFPMVFNYCEAVGIDPDTLVDISEDTATNLVLVVGTNAPIRVTSREIVRAEKAHFFKTIAGADRIVIRDGGFDCCESIEDIDKERVFVEITNAVEIAAFTSMIQFEDGPMDPPCMCCGYPGIDWWKGGKRVALTALQHGEALRWRAFSGDCPFTKESSQALARWFKEHLGIGTKDPPEPPPPLPETDH